MTLDDPTSHFSRFKPPNDDVMPPATTPGGASRPSSSLTYIIHLRQGEIRRLMGKRNVYPAGKHTML